MTDPTVKVFSAPPDAPAYPDIGDLWYDINTELFYIFDGIVWIPYTDEIIKDNQPPVEVDTPEQAYDRAMGVLK